MRVLTFHIPLICSETEYPGTPQGSVACVSYSTDGGLSRSRLYRRYAAADPVLVLASQHLPGSGLGTPNGVRASGFQTPASGKLALAKVEVPLSHVTSFGQPSAILRVVQDAEGKPDLTNVLATAAGPVITGVGGSYQNVTFELSPAIALSPSSYYCG